MIHAIDPLKDVAVIASDPRREALRGELEATRAGFIRAVDAAANAGWRQKSPTSDWSRGEVLVHLTWALENLPEEIRRARRGQGMFNIPKWLADPASYWYMRWLARTATPESILLHYERAMDAVLALLDAIPDEDWERGANFYDEGFHSVEDLFHAPAEHLAEHTPVGDR